MTVLKRYVLRLLMSLNYITANVVDRNNGRINCRDSINGGALNQELGGVRSVLQCQGRSGRWRSFGDVAQG